MSEEFCQTMSVRRGKTGLGAICLNAVFYTQAYFRFLNNHQLTINLYAYRLVRHPDV